MKRGLKLLPRQGLGRCSHLVDMGDELLRAAEVQRAQGAHEGAAVVGPVLRLLIEREKKPC